MTQKEKKLLLVDICARLPYGVILHDEYTKKDYKLNSLDANGFINYDIANDIKHIKPYLRPLSSMTKEEDKQYCSLKGEDVAKTLALEIDFLNEHHFDYRGFIEKDFALEAPEGIYDKQ